jgi:hypothetical protein
MNKSEIGILIFVLICQLLIMAVVATNIAIELQRLWWG